MKARVILLVFVGLVGSSIACGQALGQWTYFRWPGYTNISYDSILLGFSSDTMIHISTDDGYSWSSTPSDIGKFFGNQSYFLHFEYASGHTILGFAGGGANGGFAVRSSDNGVHWDSIPSIPWIGAIGGNNRHLYASSGDTLYQSTDSGKDWESLDTLGGLINNIFVADSTLFLCTFHPFGVLRSSNGGISWQKIINGLPPDFANLAAASFDTIGSALLIGLVGQEFDTADDVFRSTDNGGSWIQSTAGLTKNDTCWQFAVAGSRIFAAVGFGGVYSSEDSGKTWQPQNDFGGYSIPNIEYLSATRTTLFADFDLRRPLSDFGKSAVYRLSPKAPPISCSPNPTPGLVTISGAAASVVVTNVLGVQVLSTAARAASCGNLELDLSKLPAGTYFARIETASGVVVRRIVKQ